MPIELLTSFRTDLKFSASSEFPVATRVHSSAVKVSLGIVAVYCQVGAQLVARGNRFYAVSYQNCFFSAQHNELLSSGI